MCTEEKNKEILAAELTPSAWAKIQDAGIRYCDPLEQGAYSCKVEKMYIQPVGASLLLCIRLKVTGGEDGGKTLSKVYDLINEETLCDLGIDLVTVGMDVVNMLPEELERACEEISQASPVVYVAYLPAEDPREKPVIEISRERFDAAPKPKPKRKSKQKPEPAQPPEPVVEDDAEVAALADMTEDEDIVPVVGKRYLCLIRGRGRATAVVVTDVQDEEETCTVKRDSDNSLYPGVPFSRFESLME